MFQSALNLGTADCRNRKPAVAFGLVAVVAALLLAACGDDDTGSSGSGERKLMIYAMPFPCDLNDYAKLTCEGAEDAELPAGYELQIKTTRDYTDAPAFNNLLETVLQLQPAGMVVFANGPAAQTPVLNRACDQDMVIVFYDVKGEGVECEVSYVTPPNYEMGKQAAEWLIENPPANDSKEVAIVSQQPGQFNSNDQRVAGFQETIEAAGYEVVTTVVTTNDLEETRTKVTNALTAHPDLSAVFSANSPMGQGTAQGLNGHDEIAQLTTDGSETDIPLLLNGTQDANAAQAPYLGGKLSVESLIKALEGEELPEVQETPMLIVDKSNAKEFLDVGGLKEEGGLSESNAG